MIRFELIMVGISATDHRTSTETKYTIDNVRNIVLFPNNTALEKNLFLPSSVNPLQCICNILATITKNAIARIQIYVSPTQVAVVT